VKFSLELLYVADRAPGRRCSPLMSASGHKRPNEAIDFESASPPLATKPLHDGDLDKWNNSVSGFAASPAYALSLDFLRVKCAEWSVHS